MYAVVRLALGFMTRRERFNYFSLVVVRALTGFLDVFGIMLIGFIGSVAAMQIGNAGSEEPTKLMGLSIPRLSNEQILWLVVGVLVVFVVKALIAVFLARALAFSVAKVEARNAKIIAEFLLRGSLDDAKRYSKAEFQYAITTSTYAAFTGILNNVATIFTESFLLVVVAGAFFLVDPVAAVFALLYFGAVVIIIQVVIGRSLKLAGQDAAVGSVDTINAVSDTVDTFREISVIAKQDLFIDRIYKSRMRLAKSGPVITNLGAMPRYVVETALILGVVIFVGQQFFSGQLATGIATVGVFLTGGVRIMASLLPLQASAASIKQNVEIGALSQDILLRSRIRGEVDVPKNVEDNRPVAFSLDRSDGLPISIDKASFRYPGDDHDTLHDVTLNVEPGAHVAVIGPSGAGKTTLVDLTLGLILPSSGSVTLGGIEPNELRKIVPGAVAYVPQRPGLVSGTIAENIALGIEIQDIDHTLLNEVIDSAFLRDFMDSLPDGASTSVGKQADALSGGQIQRIGLARALYSRPRLLILDEATSGLDAGSEAFISESLAKLKNSVTVVIIAHRLSTVQHSDVVHVVEGGRITASGDFKSLRKSVPMVAEYVKLMSFDHE